MPQFGSLPHDLTIKNPKLFAREVLPAIKGLGDADYHIATEHTPSGEVVRTLGEKLKPQLVVTELARRWKALPEAERGAWNSQAKAAPFPAVPVA